MRVASAVALALLSAACSRSTPPAGAPAAPAASASGGATPAVAADGNGAAFVSAVTALRREPQDSARVKSPSGKDVSNFLATLHRGEQVTVVEAREDWAKVRLSDDHEGWLKRSALVEEPGVTPATILFAADVFDRPELLSANSRRKIEPGTLVLVLKQRAPFAEVNVAGAQTAWVLAERLAMGEKEVAVAKLVEKARWLVKTGKRDDALAALALAREHFAGVSLVDALAKELGEIPPDAAGGLVVPAVAPAPASSGDGSTQQ
jgi:hypothetical protein